MGVVVPMAALGGAHHEGAPLERLAPDLTLEIIEARHPAAPHRAPHARGVVGKGRAAHRRDCQDAVPIDAPLVADLAHLADPGIDRDLGTPSAPRRWTAQRPQGLALATRPAAVCAVPHLLWGAALSILATRSSSYAVW